jgi:hypothetical protein
MKANLAAANIIGIFRADAYAYSIFSGRRVDGHWVLGAIQNGSEDFRMIVCPNNCRSADALIPIIEQHIEKGTEIHTDAWRAYSRLNEFGYVHRVVNHSDPHNHFVGRFFEEIIVDERTLSASDGTHTQRIESSWRPAKDWFRSRHVPGYVFAEILVEYQWRRWCRKTNRNVFHQLLQAILAEYGFT